MSCKVGATPLEKFWASFIQPGDLCFDVGAHIGDTTDAMLKLGADVVAIEPYSKSIDFLHDRFSSSDRVHIEKVALGDSAGSVDLHVCISHPELCSTSKRYLQDSKFAKTPSISWSETERVQVVTLDQLICKYGEPEFIKIDAEGAEPRILRGLSKPVPLISFEFGSSMLASFQEGIELLDHLSTYVFNVYWGDIINGGHLALNAWVSGSEMVDIVFNRLETDPDCWGDIYARDSHI